MKYKCAACRRYADGTATAVPSCPKCGGPMTLVPTRLTAYVSTAQKLSAPKAIKKPRVRKLLRTAPRRFNFLNKRSASAPLLIPGKKKLILTAKYIRRVMDIASDPDWYDNTKKGIRLAFEDMDGTGDTAVQGLILTPPSVVNHPSAEVHLHFEHLAVSTMENHKTTDATEATGEAAASLAICRTPRYAGFVMLWGVHVHSGAGIDQIWHNPTAAGTTRPDGTYLIVEAKGVGAGLNTNTSAPPDIQVQMSDGWVFHNLATMARNNHQVAIDLMAHCGLTEEYLPSSSPSARVPYYPNYGGASKSYYKLAHTAGSQTAVLRRVVGTASWGTDGEFIPLISHEGVILA